MSNQEEIINLELIESQEKYYKQIKFWSLIFNPFLYLFILPILAGFISRIQAIKPLNIDIFVQFSNRILLIILIIWLIIIPAYSTYLWRKKLIKGSFFVKIIIGRILLILFMAFCMWLVIMLARHD